MPDLKSTLEGLRQERSEVHQQLGRLDEAIAALEKIVGTRSATSKAAKRPGRKRKLSAAARERIAAAQRERWAKVRQQQKAAAKEKKTKAA